jgi:hypothetical protein
MLARRGSRIPAFTRHDVVRLALVSALLESRRTAGRRGA